MIHSLTGVLASKTPTEAIIVVNGVGYGVNIPLSTFEALGDTSTTVSLFTYLHVREDVLQLFGFASEAERNLFRLLISVNGIGPRMAQGILSGMSAAELRTRIADGNPAALMTIPGVGRKLAERLVVELREKVTRLDGQATLQYPPGDPGRVRAEALLALTSLGYNRAAAERAIRFAIQETNSGEVTVEMLIKAALRHVSSPQ